jgi:dethiobiotin synthetase
MSGIFITATDTGVGKTYFTCLLAKQLRDNGYDVGVMKPISCGPDSDNDAILIKNKLKLKDPLELINPVRLKYPLSPYAAAQKSQTKINLKKIFLAYKELSKKHDYLLVEGVGGVLVPIHEDYYVADLIKDLKVPAIIVARAGLGTINHTLLTIEALKKRKVSILGVVLNQYMSKDLSRQDNGEIISKLTGVKVFGSISQTIRS